MGLLSLGLFKGAIILFVSCVGNGTLRFGFGVCIWHAEPFLDHLTDPREAVFENRVSHLGGGGVAGLCGVQPPGQETGVFLDLVSVHRSINLSNSPGF